MLAPGSGLGIFGGGQLGLMFVAAARRMGYHTLVYDPDAKCPAGEIATEHIKKEYDNRFALEDMANRCDAVTLEFENVPAKAVSHVARNCPLSPGVSALEIAQDRNTEKNFLRDCGVETVAYAEIDSAEAIEKAIAGGMPPLPAILKTARFGYDGKGQIRVDSPEHVRAAYEIMKDMPAILEECVNLKTEVSVIVVRALDGETACYPVAENIHRDGILHMSIAPARIDAETGKRVTAIATNIAEKMHYCGVLGVEFFITEDDRLLVNEIAPRPHNSGHYTIDACECSQFEQQVRVMCEMPCGSVRQCSPVVMVNTLGDVWDNGAPNWDVLLGHPGVKLTLYNKYEVRRRRKMGHFCLLGDNIEQMVGEAEKLWRQVANIDYAGS